MRFKIDWASLIVGRKFIVLLCFTLYLRAISKDKPPGAYIWRGDLTEAFLHYEFGDLYLEGLIFGVLRYFILTKKPNLQSFNKNLNGTITKLQQKQTYGKCFVEGNVREFCKCQT